MHRQTVSRLLYCAVARGLVMWLITACISAPVFAESWQSLSPSEREVLQQHRGNWDRYSPEQQQRLRHGAQRYLELSPSQREGARQQEQRYRQMSPEQRRALREEYRGRRDR